MGIPHLIAHLRRYADYKDLSAQNVVIDGPAMAYHIYRLCLTLRPGAKNPFEAAPTYGELGEAVILWLDFLQSHLLTVKKIFFDGFLPISKKSVRIERLETYTKQLRTYSAAYEPTIPTSKKLVSQTLTSESLLSAGAVSRGVTKIPAPAFQVSAILDALLASEKYRSNVQVVPDEADSFCAGYVRANGGLILTGDSDLLIHDLGPSGAVVFLTDLDAIEQSFQSGKQKCHQYTPHAIATKMGLPGVCGLRNLAFAMFMDRSATMPVLMQRSKDATYLMKYEDEYKAFMKDYDPHVTTDCNRPITKDFADDTAQFLQTLHPRLSEFVLQFPYFSQIAWASFGLASPALHAGKIDDIPAKELYLPFILDYPLSTSAWDLSTAIRLTAYSLLNLVVPTDERIQIVIERRRQENGSRGRQWTLPTLEELPEALQALVGVIKDLRNALPDMKRSEIWRAYAIYIDMQHGIERKKTSLSETESNLETAAEVEQNLRWSTIHHIAQLQATYYSLFTLQKTLTLISSIPATTLEKRKEFTSLSQPLAGLKAELADLHSLAELPGFNDERARIASPEMGVMLRVAKEMLGVVAAEDVNAEARKEKKKKKKRKRDGVDGGAVLDDEGTMSSNPFNMLMME